MRVYGDRAIYIPHPVDTGRFRFRERRTARVFLHCRGWGGYKERKGAAIVYEAARRCPDAAFLVRTQGATRAEAPPNVTVAGPSATREALYETGDVAIQPSRWEGVGLQILEAMACGIPVIVPDAAPMNEYPADRRLLVEASETTVLLEGRRWPAWETNAGRLARLIEELNGSDISGLSRRARAKMERRSWGRMRGRLMAALRMR